MKIVFLLSALLLFLAGNAGGAPIQPHATNEVVINNVEFVFVPGGWFWYPLPDRDPITGYRRGSGRREIKAWVDSYYIAKYEGRARHFTAFLNSGKSKHVGEYDSPSSPENGAVHGCSVRKGETGSYFEVDSRQDLPATHLSWNLASEWATSLGFRLPTEAEWVRAFRGDDKRIYPWGDEYPDDTYAGFQEGGNLCNPRPVNDFPKGRSPYGVYNMAGNVYEYVADWFNLNHSNALKDGVRNPVASEPYRSPDIDEPNKLLRGGRWGSGVGELSIYGNKAQHPASSSFRCYGVRFAVDAATVRQHLLAGTAHAVEIFPPSAP